MPINVNTGLIKNQNHQKWLQLMRRRQEAIDENQSFHGIDCPQQWDILFGRGWPKMSHPGNAIFRNMIDARLERYNTVKSKRDKTMIAWSIVCELRDSGARFLREDKTGWWMEVTNEEARQKVSIGFRDSRKARQRSDREKNRNRNKTKHAGIDATSDRQKVPPAASKSPSSSDESASSSKRKHATPDPSAVRFSDPDRVDDAANAAASIFLNMDGSKKRRCRPCNDDDKDETAI